VQKDCDSCLLTPSEHLVYPLYIAEYMGETICSSKQQQQQHTVGDDVLVLWMMSHAGAKRCGWCHDVSDVHQALARLI
jgi:hypothetical protein